MLLFRGTPDGMLFMVSEEPAMVVVEAGVVVCVAVVGLITRAE